MICAIYFPGGICVHNLNQCDLLCMVWTRGWNMCLVLQWNLPAMVKKFGLVHSERSRYLIPSLQHSAGEVLDADPRPTKNWDLHLSRLTSTEDGKKTAKTHVRLVLGRDFRSMSVTAFTVEKLDLTWNGWVMPLFLRWYRQPLICHTPVKLMMVLRDFSIDCKTPNDNFNILGSGKNPPPPPNWQRHVTGIPPWKLTSPMEYDGRKMKFPYIDFPGGGGILEVKIFISWIHPEPSPAINRINPSRIKVFQLSL